MNSKRWFVVASVLLLSSSIFAQRHARHEQARAESETISNVAGGSTFQTAMSYEQTYDAVLNYLKRSGESIDSASKESGQITTAMIIKGGWHQTGSRIQVTLIKDSETATTVRVAAMDQKRYKALQVEPWGSPKLNEQKSSEVAGQIKSALQISKVAEHGS